MDRIGHATRALEDVALVPYLAEQHLPLELNPWSNVCTAVIDDIAQHPIKQMREAGCLVTVNTDDPKMFGNSLAEEYALLMQTFGFSPNEVQEIILDGLRASWLNDVEKQAYIDQFKQDSAWRR